MNINIALDSNYFKPYTFQDIMAPGILFKQDWEADQERYQSIAEQLGNLEAAVQNTQIAKGLYDAYNTEFQSAVDEFNTGKLNKTRLSKLRNRYNTEIKKVQNANELYSKEATRRMNLLDKDPTMIFSDIGTLDDYIENPNRMTQSYSKENLRTQVARTMQAIGKGFANMGINGHLDKYNYQLMEQNGFTPEEINNFIRQYQSGDSSVLNTIYGQAVKNIIDSTGIEKWASDSDYNDAVNYALDGAYQGIGEMKLSHMRDEGAYAAMQHYYHELQAENAARRAAVKSKDSGFSRSGFSLAHINGGVQRAGNLRDRLFTNGSINSNYFKSEDIKRSTSDPVETTYTNPLKIYKDVKNSSQAANYSYSANKNTFGFYPSNSKDASAVYNAAKKYNVNNILTEEEYNFLTSLGLDENSTPKEINSALSNYILQGGVNDYYGSVNAAGYENISDKFIGNYNMIDNPKSIVQKFDVNTGIGGNGTKIEDDDIKAGVSDVFYSRKNPNKLIVTMGTHRYVVDPNLFDSQTARIVQQGNSLLTASDENLYNWAVSNNIINPSTPNTSTVIEQIKSSIEENVLEVLNAQFNSYNKIRSTTDSNI